MGEPDTPKNVRPIQTFAFLDIESTGLPRDSPRIIELSIVAVSRADLLQMSASAIPDSTLKTSNGRSSNHHHLQAAATPMASTHHHHQAAAMPTASTHQAAATPMPFTHKATATPTTSNFTACVEERERKVIPKLPRVLHKYTRLYYPWKMIPPSVERVSGLSNEITEHLHCSRFTEDSAQALKLFLDLPKPVALVAHNGNRFDFPIIKTELYRLGWTDKLVGLHCVDSLIAFRQIDPVKEREDIIEITKLATSFTVDDFEDELPEEADDFDDEPPEDAGFFENELTDEADFFDDKLLEEAWSPSKRLRTGEFNEEGGSSLSNTPLNPYESVSRGPGNEHHTLEVSAEPLLTPIKSRVAEQTAMPATPSKPARPPPLPCILDRVQPDTPGTPGFQAKVAGESSKVRRTLTYENSGRRRPRWRMPYKQSNIYRRLFDAEYEAHRAEEDCLALLTICGHYGSRFVEWADTFATSFEEVKPMWVKRKSFHASQEG